MAPTILGQNKQPSPDEPRLAVCKVCKKIERMPAVPATIRRVPATIQVVNGPEYTFRDDAGATIMVPEFDPVLEDFGERHAHGLDDVTSMQAIQVFPVDPKTWEKMDVVTELKKELEQVTGEFYEESRYYLEEALKCYNAHHNPTECPDYLDPSKRIGPEVSPKYQTFLCHMCPVQQSYVNVELRRRKGWYDPKNAAKLSAARDAGLSSVKKV